MTLPADRFIRKIYITAESAHDELTDEILSAYPYAEKIVIDSENIYF
jgi:hypothetical protein